MRISNKALRDVAIHWNEARGQRRMPGWSDISPRAIARHLPLIWSWKYDALADVFIGRLAGEEIVQAFGENLRGKTGEEFFKNRGGEVLLARHRRVVTEPAIYHGQGAVFAHARRIVMGERIILPLAEDGEEGDGILGVTIYNFTDAGDDGGTSREDYAAEKGEFIPL
ncbi:PAS domain-containing protein [Parvibaculum sedimenti]|nr:PAS domain-containing protein [Parvibaculum sedimenti]